MLTKFPLLKNKRELQSLLGKINYLVKVSLEAEVCKLLRKLISSKCEKT